MELSYIYYCIPFIVALFAQIIKIILDMFSGKKATFQSLLVSWGMPSAHTTLTSSLLTMVILMEWVFNPLSMIVAVYAILVRYDAANVRYESWKHAYYINSLREEMHKVMTKDSWQWTVSRFDILKERLGHTPVEIIVGILFGVAVTIGLVSIIDIYIINFSTVTW